MRYVGILIIVILLAILVKQMLFNFRFDVILYIRVIGDNAKILLTFKFLYDFIKIENQLYPPKDKKSREEMRKRKDKTKTKIVLTDILSIYRFIIKIKTREVYSNIKIGCDVFNITSSVFIAINIIYSYIKNSIDSEKMHLAIYPDYTDNYFEGDFRIHVRPNIVDITKLVITYRKIKRKNNRYKEEGTDEGNKFDTKSYGDNA